MTAPKNGRSLPTYVPLTPSETNRLIRGPRAASRWRDIADELLIGKGVWVPNMTRAELETLRQVMGRMDGRLLRSRSTHVDGVKGRVLTLEKPT